MSSRFGGAITSCSFANDRREGLLADAVSAAKRIPSGRRNFARISGFRPLPGAGCFVTALRILEANQQTRPHRATANASINASLKPLIMPHRGRGRAHFHSFFRFFAESFCHSPLLGAPTCFPGAY